MRVSNMSDYGFLLFLVTATAASFALVPASMAAHHGGPGMQGAAGHQCQHHNRHGTQTGHHGQGAQKGWHGAHHGGGGHHGKKKLFGPHWKTTLSPEQAQEMDRLRVEYLKHKMPLKAKAKAIKLGLAVLATADEPNAKAVSEGIEDLLAVKGEMMQLKYKHIAAQRRLLTPEQRVSFDMDVLKRVKRKGMKRN